MRIRERDDMEVFTYEYEEYVFHYRFPDVSIKTYDKGKHWNYYVNVWEETEKIESFLVTFRIAADDRHLSHIRTAEGIRDYLENRPIGR